MIGKTLVVIAALITAAGCSKVSQDEAFEAKVHAYLLKHPEVIEEASKKLQENKENEALAQTGALIGKNRAALEQDPRDFVANPEGKITLVEFFDYRCPYCKAALPDLNDLIANNKDVRFVFKELPILPDQDGKIGVSRRAAEAALAAKAAGKYLDVHNALMSQRALDDAAIARVLKANGVSSGSTPDGPASRQLADVYGLARRLSVTGTPTFVIGDRLIAGADLPALDDAIAQARKSAKG